MIRGLTSLAAYRKVKITGEFAFCGTESSIESTISTSK